jgi:hypothetical protein
MLHNITIVAIGVYGGYIWSPLPGTTIEGEQLISLLYQTYIDIVVLH